VRTALSLLPFANRFKIGRQQIGDMDFRGIGTQRQYVMQCRANAELEREAVTRQLSELLH